MSTLLEKIKSVKLCLMAHPDNEEHSEFADRVSDLKEIENELSKDNWVKVYKDDDLPKESSQYWIRQSDGLIQTMKEYEEKKKYWIVNATHYQPINKPDAPTT